MLHSKAARRYAKALFLLAVEQHKLDAVQADLQALAALLEASKDLRDFLGNYLIAPARRAQVLGDLFEREGRAEALLARFIFLLEEKKRMPLLREIASAFGALYDQERGIVRVELMSARPLDREQLERITERLRQQLGKDVRPTVRVNPDLLGGFIIQVGDQVRDLSVESQLRRLRRELVEA